MAEHHDPSFIPPEESSLENYTGSELPFKALYVVLAVVLVTCVVFAFALLPVKDVFNRIADSRSADTLQPSSERPSGPRLQQSPEGDWKVWERLMDEKTRSHGWQDRANGIAFIPLDAAVEHALAEGLVASQPGAPMSTASKLAAAHGGSDHGNDDHGSADSHGEAGGHADDSHSEGGESH